MDLSAALVKLIFIFNFILLCCGIFIIYYSFKNNAVTYDGEQVHDLEKFVDNMSFLYKVFIVAGIIISVVSFFGCFGAFFDSPSCLSWYIFLLFLLIILQVALGIYVHQTNGLPKDEVKGIFGGAMKKYQADNRYKSVIDKAQQLLECCGAQGYQDWIAIGMKNPPRSCCSTNADPCDVDKCFKRNCVDAIDGWVQSFKSDYKWYIGVIVGFQIILIIFTCYARGNIKERQSYEI